jgi:hypothetical protein
MKKEEVKSPQLIAAARVQKQNDRLRLTQVPKKANMGQCPTKGKSK